MTEVNGRWVIVWDEIKHLGYDDESGCEQSSHHKEMNFFKTQEEMEKFEEDLGERNDDVCSFRVLWKGWTDQMIDVQAEQESEDEVERIEESDGNQLFKYHTHCPHCVDADVRVTSVESSTIVSKDFPDAMLVTTFYECRCGHKFNIGIRIEGPVTEVVLDKCL